ncbi:MAG: hypothetical protein JWM47_3370, partial [Acidimicrobiales bacterium]|nr:hypothetical protein [Acidimicrobiales bacterium]
GRLAPRRQARPPGGQIVASAQWFDDGSFSRWAQRNLPPAGPLLAAVGQALPAPLVAELQQALIAVAPGGDDVPATPPPAVPGGGEPGGADEAHP